MRVLIVIDQSEGLVKKAALEAISYAVALAAHTNTTAEGLVLGNTREDLAGLGRYGIKKIHHATSEALNNFDAQVHTRVIAQAVEELDAAVVIFSSTADSKAIAPRLSARLQAGLVTGAVALPATASGFVVTKTVFSGKAFADISIPTPIKIITLNPNAYKTQAGEGSAEVIPFTATAEPGKIKVTAVNKVSGEISLSEADIVVSGGRGLKGPENWGMVEELAHLLHAATACSRPVADIGWRPHHEHVGQTGLAIAPDLYIAIGISGAIQHLAGVNRSKTIVVINKDPEAPFFKAADYGIVGDAFDVVPKIIAAVKQLR
jgi:electron transfer flavoprotein alpha subunit